jgi:hypothetical protein
MEVLDISLSVLPPLPVVDVSRRLGFTAVQRRIKFDLGMGPNCYSFSVFKVPKIESYFLLCIFHVSKVSCKETGVQYADQMIYLNMALVTASVV